MQSERMADIIQEMRMARTEFPFAYAIGRKDEPEEFDADGLMVKPRSIVIKKVTIETLADRIEKAWEREKQQPDPDWKAICEKCKEGEIEPDCEYYGEPNGCNSPIYGEHPKSQPIGNAAAMRDTLEGIRLWLIASANVLEEDTTARVKPRALRKLAKDCDKALAARPRNCDVGTSEEQSSRMREYCLGKDSLECRHYCMQSPKAFDCVCEWAQMQYEKGGAE